MSMAMDIDMMATEIAQKMLEIISHSSFTFWKQKEFREMVSFDDISQTEQDRIFNELVVSGVVFLMFILDSYVADQDANERRIVMSKVRDKVPEAYIKTLAGYGIEREFRRIWKKLIDLRLKEYLDNRRLAQEEAMYADEFKGKEEFKDIWVRIETIAIGCLFHIRRGKGETKDPLWKAIRHWLISLEADLGKLLSQFSKL